MEKKSVGRPRKKDQEMKAPLDEAVKKKVAIEDMPLETMRDYRLYNEAASAENKRLKLKIPRYPIKPCPIELHPTERIVFNTKNGSPNPIPLMLSDSKIHWQQKLTPGQTYELPKYVINYIQSKGEDVYGMYQKPDQSYDSKVTRVDPRFAVTSVFNYDD